MRYHSQNLNETKGKVTGSMLWRGRAWIYLTRERYDESFRVEWCFGKYARDFAITASFGYGDSDAGVCLHACLPWLFSVYLVIPGVYHCRESQTGIAIHNGAIWLYPFTDQHESRRDHPWWKKNYSWYFPWNYERHLTEILEHKSPETANAIWCDTGKSFMDSYEERVAAQKLASRDYDYTYTLKSGEVQKRKATVYVDRMTWRMRWWPVFRGKVVRTSISFNFDGEVGEETGSWKGGCIGSGYEMKPGEAPLETLRRMEAERKF